MSLKATKYVCDAIMNEKADEISSILDKLISKGKYKKAIKSVESIDFITEEQKERLKKCVLSYKNSC